MKLKGRPSTPLGLNGGFGLNGRGLSRSRRAESRRARFFVTGTDTGVGKTEVSAALLASMVDLGLRPFAFKPCESGGNVDSEALWEAAGRWQPRASVCLYRFRAPLAPALAACAERKQVSWRRLLSGLRAAGDGPGVVDGAGGLFVPLDDRHDVIDLIDATGLPVVLVARAGLGTINHTVLSLDALLARHITVAAVVLVQVRRGVDPSIATNRPELERRFPQVAFFGPVPFKPHAHTRRALIAQVLAPLVQGQPTRAK